MTPPADLSSRIGSAGRETAGHLATGILPFWLRNGLDHDHGGYLTTFDAEGRAAGDGSKFLVTQARMIWGFSALAEILPERADLLDAARLGVDFFHEHFWDRESGGWVWKVTREGACLDDGKVVYGQAFAIYALSQHALATGDPRSLASASETFDLLEAYAADLARGGYLENLERDWRPSEPGFAAGDRKSLDVHMHLLEAFTVLLKASGRDEHRRRLEDVIDLIVTRMIDPQSGAGRNQFTLDWVPIPAIAIRRTWNADRFAGEALAQPADTTSYGHNVELAWLLNRAGEVLGLRSDHFDGITRRLVDHALEHGLDPEHGGVYRDGPHAGEAIVHDKEWWQNAEVLVGFLDAYEHFGDLRYFDAFWETWRFVDRCFINRDVGEWRQLLTRDGRVLVGDIGNPWKAIYHTGRSMLECRQRLGRLADVAGEAGG